MIGPQLRRVESALDHILQVNLVASPPAGRSKRAFALLAITGSLAVVGVTVAVLYRGLAPTAVSKHVSDSATNTPVEPVQLAFKSPSVAVAAPLASTTTPVAKRAPATPPLKGRGIVPTDDDPLSTGVMTTQASPVQASASERTPTPLSDTATRIHSAATSVAVATPEPAAPSAQPALPSKQDGAKVVDSDTKEAIERRERERAIDAMRQLRAR